MSDTAGQCLMIRNVDRISAPKETFIVLGFSCQHSITNQAPNTVEALTGKASHLLSSVISLLLQPVLAVGISSILNYHTCHLDLGRINGIAHIMLQNHFLSKYSLQTSEVQRTKRGKYQLRVGEEKSILR